MFELMNHNIRQEPGQNTRLFLRCYKENIRLRPSS